MTGHTAAPRIPRRRPRPIAALLLMPLLAATAPAPSVRAQQEQQEEARRPNIVIILADDLGYSDLGCFGGEIETPNLDRLAAGGLRFSQFTNAARCCPTRAALLTGLDPHRAGVGHMVNDLGRPSYQGYLDDRSVTIAEALRPAGYATLMAGKWHVGSAPGRWPLDRGFDHYFGTPSGGGVYFKDTLQIRAEVFFVEDADRVDFPDDAYVTDLFTDHAIRLARDASSSGRPFFLYLAHIAPHWPLQALPEDIDKYRDRYAIGWDAVREARHRRQLDMGLVDPRWPLSPRDPEADAWSDTPEPARADLAHRMAVYAAQVDRLDQSVGRLVAALEGLGALDDTAIFFLSDNGCSAEGGPGGFSRGMPDAPIGTGLSYASAGLEWANACDTPFRKFKMSAHEGGIATPLIVHWPLGIDRRGAIDHQPGHVIDLMPTCLGLAGAPFPADRDGVPTLAPEGRSLVPALSGGSIDRDAPLCYEHQGNRAIRLGRWKLVAAHGRPWELYDLDADRTETLDLAAGRSDLVAELAARYDSWADRAGVAPWPVRRP